MITVRPLSSQEHAETETFCRQPGCPTETAALVVLEIPLVDVLGGSFLGTLVTHHTLAQELAEIFVELQRIRYPIERMRPLTFYYGDDDKSMADNNSSCFNGRVVHGTTRWSYHAFGRAVDLNPLINPWIREGETHPPAGQAYVDRTQEHPALLRPDSPAVKVFETYGWEWGGHWIAQGPDYHHFQKPWPPRSGARP